MVPHISKVCIAFIFSGEAVKALFLDPSTLGDEGITFLCNIRHHMPSETALHARRPESTATPL